MTLTTVRRRFVIITFSRWLATGLTLPILVLLGRERGLSLAAIGALMAVYSVTTLVLELPTGGLADVVGRRPLLMWAASVSVASSVVLACADSPPLWLVGLLFMGAARALDSGPLQAWFVDATHGLDPAATVRVGLSRAGAAGALGIGLGSLASGVLVSHSPFPTHDGTLVALSTPMLASAVITVLNGLLVALWVAESRDGFSSRLRDIGANVPVTLRRGATLVVNVRPLRRILLLTTALGAGVSAIELLAPGHFSSLFGGASDAAGPYSVLVTAGFAGSAAGSALAPLATRILTRPTRVIAVASVGAGIALPVIASSAVAVACVAFVAFYFILDLGGPLLDEITHDAVASSERATVLSMRSMAVQGSAAIISVSMGALSSATSIALSLAVAGSLLALGSLAMWRYPTVHAGGSSTDMSRVESAGEAAPRPPTARVRARSPRRFPYAARPGWARAPRSADRSRHRTWGTR